MLASLNAHDRAAFLANLRRSEAERLLFDWYFWARPEQREPAGTWFVWLILAGRGFGKTRTGAETVRRWAETGRYRRLALVGRTAADVRDVMIEGESGILACSPPSFRPKHEPSNRRLRWPNGVVATTFTAEEPDSLRGPQHDGAWADELAAWQFPEAWDQLKFGLRGGDDPRAIVTTTPRPTPVIKTLKGDPTTCITGGSTYDNIANLPPVYVDTIVRPYEGTRLGRQELLAEILDDTPGALWTRALLERQRIRAEDRPALGRIVIGVDPEGTAGEESASTGIVACGREGARKGRGYVLDDMTVRGTPGVWAQAAIDCYRKWEADAIVAEVNNGGDMVAHTIHTIDPKVRVVEVRASRNKTTRAEPIATLFEHGDAYIVQALPDLEDQLTTWVQGERSPDRLDAMVWALHELFIEMHPSRSSHGFAPTPELLKQSTWRPGDERPGGGDPRKGSSNPFAV